LHALRSDTPADPSSAIFLLGALPTLREFELPKKVIFLFTPPVKLAGQQVQIINTLVFSFAADAGLEESGEAINFGAVCLEPCSGTSTSAAPPCSVITR